jgi:hypothetical protein
MINALVPLMLRVVEEDTPTCDKSGGVCVWGGRWGGGELMESNGREVGIAGALEDPKVGVRGSGGKGGKVG